MKTKHTKGEWFIEPKTWINQYGRLGFDISPKNGPLRDIITIWDSDDLEGEANAKLVAVAPELLEMLVSISENLELQLSIRGCQTESAPLKSDADSYGGLELLMQARELIKKATE